MGVPVLGEEAAAVLAALAAQQAPHLADLPAPVMRQIYGQLGAAFDIPADPRIRTVDFRLAACPLRIFFPEEVTAGPVVLFFHGGGFVLGNLDTHASLCGLIVRLTGLRVVAVDYRLAPEHPFPRAHDDCLAAAAFVAGSPAVLEQPVTGVALAGDSAGGNLALHVATQIGTALGQLLFYPLADCTGPTAGSYVQFAEGYVLDRRLMDRFLGDYLPDLETRNDPAVSPLGHLPTQGWPPSVILTAEFDPLRDQGRALAARLAGHGTETHYFEAPGQIHGMATMRQALPAADRIVRLAIETFAAMIGDARKISPETQA